MDGMRLSQHGGRLSAQESRELFEGESEAVPAVAGTMVTAGAGGAERHGNGDDCVSPSSCEQELLMSGVSLVGLCRVNSAGRAGVGGAGCHEDGDICVRPKQAMETEIMSTSGLRKLGLCRNNGQGGPGSGGTERHEDGDVCVLARQRHCEACGCQ